MTSALNYLGKNLLSHDWLTEAINEHYKSIGKASWGKPKSKLSPSSIYDPCPRAIEIGMLGYRSGTDPQSRRRMDNGTFGHDRWRQLFADMKIINLAEEFFADPDEAGTLDLVLQHPQNSEDLWLIEFKTINSNGWRKLPAVSTNAVTNAANLTRVQPKHVAQWLTYDHLLYVNNRDVGKGFILYENKDTQMFTPYFMVRDEPLWKNLTDNGHKAQEFLRRGELYPPPFPKASKTCSECYVKDICFRQQEGDIMVEEKLQAALKQVAVK